MNPFDESAEAHRPAFPVADSRTGDGVYTYYGLTKREYFAAAALTGLCMAIGPGYTPTRVLDMNGIAEDCFLFADAMLAESAK
jgi:hypothetical protein